ncbi:hypothetical protein [Variovorax sp. PCZ-1]|uniref:hypothetical protein n=1 Tax=Variovorax sp. PCZ-1 TaxID=2835533 RepID=UPI001BCBDDF8|nr:hypothetical protein [Variovorax sp. PCZ-1]MBS7808043.1 hypothetical protein [Variovorax sp. PCZ-1]
MALLAESLVEEWLNRQGFFTVRGVRAGVDELDLLAIRPRKNGLGLEARHVEVQMSVNPIAYISSLTSDQTKLYGKGKTSAWRRPDEALPISVAAWVNKKFLKDTKILARNRAWPDLQWTFQFVHGKVKHHAELTLIASYGIELIPFHSVLSDLCDNVDNSPKSGAGSDIADMFAYYEEYRDR